MKPFHLIAIGSGIVTGQALVFAAIHPDPSTWLLFGLSIALQVSGVVWLWAEAKPGSGR